MIDITLLLSLGAIHRKVLKAQAIFCQDETAHFYYQVITGKVKMVSCNEGGKEFIQGIYTNGETFGELSLLDGDRYAASAVAEEDSMLIRLGKERFIQLLKEDLSIHFAFTCLLAKRLRFKSLLLNELSCYGPEHRIITLIRHLKLMSKVPVQALYKVDLTRQQLADMTGLRVETVIRVIRTLYGKGALILEKGKVYM